MVEKENSSSINKTLLIIVGIAMIAFVLVILLVIFNNLPNTFQRSSPSASSFYISTSSPNALTPVGEGIISLSATRKNQTWLEFDGVDDEVVVNSNFINSISFWYKNKTSDWIFVTNSSGTLYVNSVENTPSQYPVYYDGTDYFIGRENESLFFNGSIDDFRVSDSTLDQTLINLIYADGRI